MESHWLTRALARVVLVAYGTQLFAPVVYAMEEGGVKTLRVGDHFAHQRSEFATVDRLSPRVKIANLQSQTTSHPPKVKLADPLPSKARPQGLPTLSIQLEYLPEDIKPGGGYRLSIEQSRLFGGANTLQTRKLDCPWQQDFSVHDLASDPLSSPPLNHYWMRWLSLHLSESGQLTARSLPQSGDRYQGYHYVFNVDGDLRLTHVFTNGFINVQKAKRISAQDTVYAKTGIRLNAFQEIRTRSRDPQTPTLLLSDQKITLKAPCLDNENSLIKAPVIQGWLGRAGQENISLNNTNGAIIAEYLLDLHLATAIANTDGVMDCRSGPTKIVGGSSLQNERGQIKGYQQLDLSMKEGIDNPSGQLWSSGDTTVQALSMDIQGVAEVKGRNLTISVTQALKANDPASQLSADRVMRLTANTLYQASPFAAKTVYVNTINELNLASAQFVETLHLCTENGPILYQPNELQATRLLSLTTKNIPLNLTIPLKTPGAFEATAPEIVKQTTVLAKGGITLNASSTSVPYPVRNEGDLVSDTKGLTVNAQGFSHTKSHLSMAGDFMFTGQNLRLRSLTSVGGTLPIVATGERDIDFSQLAVDGLLHLTLPSDQQKLTDPIKIAGRLELDRAGNSPEPLHLLADLIPKKGLKVRIPEAPLIVGAEDESQPMVKLQTDEGFLDLQSKSLDLVKAQLFSQTGMRWEVKEKQIHIGRGIVEDTPQTFNYKWNFREYNRISIALISCALNLLDPRYSRAMSAQALLCSNSVIYSFLAPFTSSNGTFVVTEGPFTMVSPQGALFDQADLKVGGEWDVTTQVPVRNEGGEIDIQGDIHIHDSDGRRIPSASLQNTLLTQTHPIKNHAYVLGSFTYPLSRRGKININGNLKVSCLENTGGFVHIAGEYKDVKVIPQDINPTLICSVYNQIYAILNESLQEKHSSQVSPAKGIIIQHAKDPLFEGVLQSPLIIIGFEGTARVGRIANYHRPPTPPFQQMKRFMEVQRPTAMFEPVMDAPTPWINQPTVPLSWSIPLPPAVGIGPNGLYLLGDGDKVLLHPLQEVGNLPCVLSAQLQRGYLDAKHPDALGTYIMGRHKAYELYQRFFAPKALEGGAQPQTPPESPERALTVLSQTLAHMSEEDMEQLKFMMLYYGASYEGRTVHLPTSWVSKQYDNPKLRNPDGGIFADVVIFKGEPGAKLHCVSTIYGEKLVGLDVPHITIEQQSYRYITYHTNTTYKKGSWWSGDSYQTETVAVHHNEPQHGTGHLSTGAGGQLALKSDNFELKNGAHLEAGTKGIAVDIDHLIASPAVQTSLGQSHASAGGTSISRYFPVYRIEPATATSAGGITGRIGKMDLESTHLIAFDKDINLRGKTANFSAHREVQKLGTTVTKEDEAVTVTESSVEIAMPCALKALKGNVLLTYEDSIYGEATQFLGRIISLDSEDTDIETLLMAATTNLTSTTQGMFSTQTVTGMQESPTAVRCIFEGEEVHFKGGKAKIGGAHISTRILYDHTTGGVALNPVIRKMHSRQESTVTQPWCSSAVGREGWQEFMVPTFIDADEIIITSPNGKMVLNSVEYDKLKTTITGNFEEIYYQLQSAERSWAEHHQAIPNEVLMVGALAVSIATYGAGTGAFLASSCGLELAVGGMGAAMANAGAATLLSGALSSFGRTGDLAATVQEVCSPTNLKALGISMASAGLCHEIFTTLKIPMNPAQEAASNKDYIPGFTDFLESGALKAAINVPLNIGIGGQSASEALVTAAKDVPLNAGAAWGAYNIGDLGFKGKISPLQQDFAHAGFHGVIGAIQHPDQPVKAAITAGANAFVAARTSRMMFGSPEEINEQAKQQLREEDLPLTKENISNTAAKILYWKTGLISLLNASATALITRDPSMVATSIFTTTNVTENNCVPSMTKSVLVSQGYKYSEQDMKEGFWQDKYADADDLYFEMAKEPGAEYQNYAMRSHVDEKIESIQAALQVKNISSWKKFALTQQLGMMLELQTEIRVTKSALKFITADIKTLREFKTGIEQWCSKGLIYSVSNANDRNLPTSHQAYSSVNALMYNNLSLAASFLPVTYLETGLTFAPAVVQGGQLVKAVGRGIGNAVQRIRFAPNLGRAQLGVQGRLVPMPVNQNAITFFENMNLTGEANITNKIFAFTRNEQGTVRGLGKGGSFVRQNRTILDGEVSSPVNLNYNVLGYPNTQQVALGKLYTDMGVGYSNKTFKGKYAPLIEEISLYGKNPVYARLNRYGKFEVHTEIVATFPEEAARNFFSRITGQKLPVGCIIESLETPGGKVFVFRKQGDSGHPKVELINPGIDKVKIINEKITFKQKELKIVSHTHF